MNMTTVLAVLLGLSALGNAATVMLYMDKRDEVASLGEQVKTANAAALSCSKATDRYREAAENRALEAEKRAAGAEALAKHLEQRGDGELTRQPAIPGDPCRSAQAENDEWLAKRRSGK